MYNLCRKSSIDAFSWSTEEFITTDLTSNTQPSIFFDNNLLHLMWTHAIVYDTNNDVYYEHFDYATKVNTSHQIFDINLISANIFFVNELLELYELREVSYRNP